MNARGTWLVAAILLLALLVAGLTQVYHWNRAKAVLEFFGPENAALIRSAEQVFLIREIDGETERRDISHVADLDDLKKALVEDASYRLPLQLKPCLPEWTTRLEFQQDSRSYTVEIDPKCGYVRDPQTKRELDAEPIKAGLQEFVDFAISRTSPLTEKNDSE